MKKFTLLLLIVTSFVVCKAQLPNVVAGSIQRIANFNSQFVSARNIDIWLPEGYVPTKKYAVLYMHDGQMLFDANTTWNKTAWDIDDVASKLIETHKVKEFIIVGIWNDGNTRHADYFPQQPYESLSGAQKDGISAKLQKMGKSKEVFAPQSDAYLKFLVTELKPIIDAKYSIYKDVKHTFIAGSSMGGLISMYAICEYPDVFGAAICMSTHWPGIFEIENNPIPDAFINYMEDHLPNPKNHKFYFDYGDQTLDALYPPLQKRVDQLMKKKGFTNKNWRTKYFPGENHSEQAWNKRVAIPLLMVLKK
jgi:predicted alpha/beta superfamily hydrolase